jgi:hypothetical protein
MFNSYRDKLKYTMSRQQYSNPTSARAIVRKVYPESYRCDILIVENTDPGVGHEAKNVPLPYIGGISYSLPHVGDAVLVEFLNGDVQYPYIIQTYPSNPMQLASNTYAASSTMEHLSELR